MAVAYGHDVRADRRSQRPRSALPPVGPRPTVLDGLYEHLATQLTKRRLLESQAAASIEAGNDGLAAIHELLLRVERAGSRAHAASICRRKNYEHLHAVKIEEQLGLRGQQPPPLPLPHRSTRVGMPVPGPPPVRVPPDAPGARQLSRSATSPSALEWMPPLPQGPPPPAALGVGESQLMRMPPPAVPAGARGHGHSRFAAPRGPRPRVPTIMAASQSSASADGDWLRRAAAASGMVNEEEDGAEDREDDEAAAADGDGDSEQRRGADLRSSRGAQRPATAPGAQKARGSGVAGRRSGTAAASSPTPPTPTPPSQEACVAVAEAMRTSALFDEWDPAALCRLVSDELMTWRELGRYAVIHREGQPSASFYIVVSGCVMLTSSRKAEEHVLSAGETFGHAALVLQPREAPMPHLHTAITKQRTWLLVLSQAAIAASAELRALFSCDGPTGANGGSADQAECKLIADRLSTFSIFSGVPPLRMMRLARLFRYEQLPAETALTREGQKATRFCLLLSGSVAVTKRAAEPGAPDVTLAVIDAEAEIPYFGENCILSAQMEAPSGASVTTREPSHMFVVYREAAQEFLNELPEFGNILLERKALLRRTNKLVVEGAVLNAAKPLLERRAGQ